jgi:DNA-binding SARP family transcriptional activator
MARLSLALFGPPRVTLDGQEVTRFRYDKVLGLLAYLAVESAQAHRWGSLAGLLWPEQPEAAARHSLRQALLSLRSAIGDRDAQPPFVVADAGTIRFNPDGDHELDVAELGRLMSGCAVHAPRPAPDCDACGERLERGAALHRGSFLEQFHVPSEPFHEWAAGSGERLRRQAVELLARLAERHERSGALERASACLRRVIALDPARAARLRAECFHGACCRRLRERLIEHAMARPRHRMPSCRVGRRLLRREQGDQAVRSCVGLISPPRCTNGTPGGVSARPQQRAIRRGVLPSAGPAVGPSATVCDASAAVARRSVAAGTRSIATFQTDRAGS